MFRNLFLLLTFGWPSWTAQGGESMQPLEKAWQENARAETRQALELAGAKSQLPIPELLKLLESTATFDRAAIPLKGNFGYVLEKLLIKGVGSVEVKDVKNQKLWSDPKGSFRRVALFFNDQILAGHCVLDDRTCAFTSPVTGPKAGVIVFGEQTISVLDLTKKSGVYYLRDK